MASLRKYNFRKRAAVLLVFGAVCSTLVAQPALIKRETDSVLRDAVIHVPSGALYVTAYDHDEVRKLDIRTGSILATAATGDGPTQLAISPDGTTLACVSRIAKTVVLIETATMRSTGQVAVGDGGDDIAALPGGGFAIANSFEDSVTLIDPDYLEAPAKIENVASVPSAVAASDSYLAVTTRTPAALRLYTSGSGTPSAIVPLPDGPAEVLAAPEDRFVVACKNRVCVVDATTASLVADTDAAVHDLAISDDRVFLLLDTGVEIRDLALGVRESIDTTADARSLAAGSNFLVLLAPKAKVWYARTTPEYSAPSAPASFQAAPAEASRAAETPGTAQAPAMPSLTAPGTRKSDVADAQTAQEATPVTATLEANYPAAATSRDAVSAQAINEQSIASVEPESNQPRETSLEASYNSIGATPPTNTPSPAANPQTDMQAEAGAPTSPVPTLEGSYNGVGASTNPAATESNAGASATNKPPAEAAISEESIDSEPRSEPSGKTTESSQSFTPNAEPEDSQVNTAESSFQGSPPSHPETASNPNAAPRWWRRNRTRMAQAETPPPAPKPDHQPRPDESGRPAISPIEAGPRPPTFGDVVTEGLEIGTAPSGFEPPDWTQPYRDVQADRIERSADGSQIIAEGNVRLTLDTVQFAADHFSYDRATGRMHVSGNVEIIQGLSSAYADEITYVVPLHAQLENPPPLVAASDDPEQSLARKLLSMGSLDATNIEILEPARKIKADRIVYDFQSQTGQAWGVEGEAGQIRFGGEIFSITGDGEMEGTDLWLTTCDCEHEYYRLRLKQATIRGGQAVTGRGAQLELGSKRTPIYWPRWGFKGGETPTVGFDFDSGRKAELGYYLNVGQQFGISPQLELGLRFFPTTKEGVGFGIEGAYDYMTSPAAPLFLGKGEFRTLYTTKDRGYYEWFHRHELTKDAILLAQLEQWSDRDFYKDFYYERYKDRTQPRNFVNVTLTKQAYIATATVRKTTNDFVSETERAPEVTFHLLERQLAKRLYFTFDTIDGYNEREPEGDNALRSVNVARLSYDIELGQSLNLTPFAEFDATWYGKTREGGDSDGRLAATVGVTAQTRLQRSYAGRWGFSSFKHIVLPSITYSYRPEPNLAVEETPRFDAYDNVYGRSRLEMKLDNMVLGKDEETGETWQVARLSLYHGNDFWNEIRKSDDYEIEVDVRPRSWWGFQAIGEHHGITGDEDIDFDEPFIVQRSLIELYERVVDEPFDPETADKYNTRYGDYDRILTFLYYDNRERNGNFNGRIGFAYTKTQDEVFNREILYGMGYRLNEKWSFAFEHRYDLERDELYRQKYEIRRVMHCLEGALQFGERESGWDVGVEFSLTGIPGARVKF